MKKIITFASLYFLIVASCVVSFAPAAQAQSNLRQPVVSSSGLTITYTAGTINNGGHAVAITAGTVTATASRTDCAAPTYTICGFVYSNSSGTVAYTTALATAAAQGNTLMAFAESDGGGVTKLSFPLQNGALFTSGLLVGSVNSATNAAGTAITGLKLVIDKCTLGTNCAVTFTVPFTSQTSYQCTGTDQTAAAAVKVVNTSASVATFTGTGTDVISFICGGN